ncbi:MAG: A24 family peptidase [Planctomycetota bacterium]
MRPFLAAIVAMVLNGSFIAGDARSQETSEEQDSEPTVRRSIPELPTMLPDGRALRAIGFFESQVTELVPKYFEPIEIDQLQAAIERLVNSSKNDETSRLLGAIYWINVDGDTLISERSFFDIECYRRDIVRRSLGRVNLALTRNGVSSTPLLPRLVSAPDGSLEAVVDGASQVNHSVEFQWKLRGKVSGSGHDFAMRIPPVPQARMILSAPSNVSVTAIDGVLRRLPNPLPDVIEFLDDRDWYEIDAGGLDTVRIRTEQLDEDSDPASFVVRQSSVQYRAELSGLVWTSRMVVQPTVNRPFPKINVRGTTITSAKVNGTDVAFSNQTVGDRQQELQLELPLGLIDSQSPLIDVTLSGYSSWTNRRGWCDLPMPIWTGSNVVYASTMDDVELSVSAPLHVAKWELPSGWNETSQDDVEDADAVFRASGPPIALANQTSSDEIRLVTSQPNWSRVRFSQRPTLDEGTTLLRLEEKNESLYATSRIAFKVDPNRIAPLRLSIQPGWTIESASYWNSGRLIETAGIDDTRRFIDLWPEAEDVEGDEIRIEVEGSRRISATTSTFIPPTWFTRIDGVRGDFIAALLQPADFNWNGQSTLQRLADPPDDLDLEQLDFFAGADEQTLWFQPSTSRTPRVGLQKPTVAFSTSTLFQVFTDGDDLVETVMIEVESLSQSIKEISIDTGKTLGRPPLRWSISGINESPTTSFAPSDVTIGEGDQDGIYTIDVSDKTLRGRRLIGRRGYPIESNVQIPLPSVPGAASQQSEVHVGPGLIVQNDSQAIQRVPFGAQSAARYESSIERPLTSELRRVSRLRYDAVEQPSLNVQRSVTEADVTVVYREQIRVTASSRGSDVIEAQYTVLPATDFSIQYDPELQLSSVVKNGRQVDLASLPQRPIVFKASGEKSTIRVRWTRSQFQSSWLRRCRIPNIKASGTILRSDCELISASDTFVPAALWRGRSDAPTRTVVMLRPGKTVTLVRRNIALALGWLLALVVFAAGWRIASESPTAMASVLTVLATVLLLWWPWRLAVIGWLVIPALAATLLATSQKWIRRERDGPPSSYDGSTASQANPAEPSDFSMGGIARIIIWVMLGSSATMTLFAQDAETLDSRATKEAPATIPILVPMTAEGQPYGEMVYLPESIKNELFPIASALPAQQPSIQWASYRLQLDSEVNGPDPESGCVFEVEYLLHIEPNGLSSTPVRLSLPPDSVTLIERVDEPGGLIPFRTSSDGDVVAVFPSGDVFQIRVTLRPAVNQVGSWIKLFLPVQSVAATRLTVESTIDIDAIRVGGTTGNLLRETDLRRWIDDIGPVDSLEIDFRPEAVRESEPLQRRYWINANTKQVSIDCEVDPPTTLATGEAFQFVVRDSRLPVLTSTDWKLERSEQYTPSRRLMTFTSLRDSPGPVRLLWIEPTNIPEAVDSTTIRIPEVIAAALGDNAPAWIAMNTDPSAVMTPDPNIGMEVLSVDHFLASWTGYRSGIDRAVVASTELPTLELARSTSDPLVVEEQEEIRVTPNRMEVNFSARVLSTDGRPHRLSIRFPRSLLMIDATVNGKPIRANPLATGRYRELPLGYIAGEEPSSINFVAIGQFSTPNSEPVTPPRVQLISTSELNAQSVVTLYRDTTANVVLSLPDDSVSQIPTPDVTPESLVNGWIPVARWVREPDASDANSITFDVNAVDNRFSCSQLISLNQADNQWNMKVTIGFLSYGRNGSAQTSTRVPDYVDLELPTNWCADLSIEPATLIYAQRAGTDESRQILRIYCDRLALEDELLTLTGRLQDSESGRVSVPAVRVLGAGNRRTYVDVPNQIDREPIKWRTSAVEAIGLPDRWEIADGKRSTYIVASASWSIDLAPLPSEESSPVAFTSDGQLFVRDDDSLLLCHWDLFPGNLESVRVRLPANSEIVGAWSAGRAVVASMVQDESAPSNVSYIDLPLTVSGLSQPIELLLKLPDTSALPNNYVPELEGVSVTRNWLVQYVPTSGVASVSADMRAQKQKRALALAQSVIDSVSAVGRTAQRPRDEVAAWLNWWVNRYQMICRSVGRTVDLRQPSLLAVNSEETDAQQLIARQSLPIHLQWRALDADFAKLLDRLLPSDASLESLERNSIAPTEPTIFTAGDYNGFLPKQIVALSATNRPRAISSLSDSDRGLRTLIINVLTLLLVSGMLLCLHSMRTKVIPVVVHPALWLGLIGVFGFVVAPIAVAGAIVLVAVTLPVFPRNRKI